MRRMIVIEANEIPPGILRWYAASKPHSYIAEAIACGTLGSTIVSDQGVHELYPSQTWASVATGVPYDKHGVYWYGDPKPPEFALYWQAAAAQRRVGVVGTLHSSPFDEQCRVSEQSTAGGDPLDGLVFAVPDVFGPDSQTIPSSLQPLQAFNQQMTTSNARAVTSTAPLAAYADGVRSLKGSGVGPATLARLAGIAGQVALGRVAKERLRTAQFLLMADVFDSQVRQTVPDLGVLFTNHVAAAMHRYWPASFPHDWDQPLHGPAWNARYQDEIPAALAELDRMIGRILTWCRCNDATLVLISSMGQVGGGQADDGGDETLVVKDPAAFAAALGMQTQLELRSSMVPHLTYHFADDGAAKAEAERLRNLTLTNGNLTIDRSGVSVTITYHLDDVVNDLVVDGKAHDLETAGLSWLEVSEHKAGTHDEIGSLLVVNSPTAAFPDEPVDYLDLAPAILIGLGLEPLPHHKEPAVVL